MTRDMKAKLYKMGMIIFNNSIKKDKIKLLTLVLQL